MTEFAALRPKPYSYFKDDNEEDKKTPIHQKLCHKTKT